MYSRYWNEASILHPDSGPGIRLAAGWFAAPAAAQSRAESPKKWTTPRTPDGRPDLQGIWTNATITPFERPRELAAKNTSPNRKRPSMRRRSWRRAIGIAEAAIPIADVGELITSFGSTVVPKSYRPGERRSWWILLTVGFRP